MLCALACGWDREPANTSPNMQASALPPRPSASPRGSTSSACPEPSWDTWQHLRLATTQSGWASPALGRLGTTSTPSSVGQDRNGARHGEEGFLWLFGTLHGGGGSPRLLASSKGRAAPGGKTSQELGGSAAQHGQGKALAAGVKGKAVTAVRLA